jgi:hypothetical protein
MFRNCIDLNEAGELAINRVECVWVGSCSQSYAPIRSLSVIFARVWSSLKSSLVTALRYIGIITSSSMA